MRRSRRGLALAALLAACAGNEVSVPTTTLERPVAVGFVCADLRGRLVDTSLCAEAGEGGPTLYAVVGDSSPGELGLADVSTRDRASRLIDLDESNPGIQLLEMGRILSDAALSPATIGGRRAKTVRAVTANSGSCDLGIVDVQEILDHPGTARSSRVTPTVSGVALRARPRALAFVPGRDDQVYVTFPVCGLLARIDLGTGAVLEGLTVTADGRIATTGAPACPVECGVAADPCAGACPSTALPGDLEVADDGSALVMSAAGGSFVVVAALDRDDGTLGFARVVPLDGDTATDRVRVSPTTRYGRFAYAAARDGSVRVISLDELRECETNPDPRVLPAGAPSGCYPMGTPRRPLSRGPGIDLASTLLPVDIAFAELTRGACCGRDGACTETSRTECEGTWSGGGSECPVDGCYASSTPAAALGPLYYDGVFAFVLESNGHVVTVDVDDQFYADAVPHTRRSGQIRFAGADRAFRRQYSLGSVWKPLPLVGGIDDAQGAGTPQAPSRTFGAGQPAPDDRYPKLAPTTSAREDLGVLFPDPLRAPTDGVSLTFEGVLPGTARTTGRLEACDGSSSNVCLKDEGAAFCSHGVEDHDLVELIGCTSDADCRTVETCLRDPQAALEQGGMCVCSDAADPQVDLCLARDNPDCAALFATPRKYCIHKAKLGEIVLGPTRLLPKTAIQDDPTMPDAVYVCDPPSGDANVPLPPPSCFPAGVRYRVRARDALLVQSDQAGFVHRIVAADADGSCVADASRSPLLQSKIALDPPPCVDSAIPERNPCATRDLVRLGHPLYDLTVARAQDRPRRDPGQDFQIIFHVTGSFEPLDADLGAFLPAAIELGPDGLLYVVDQGDEVFGVGRGHLARMDPYAGKADDFVVR
jgi:hypothetical protein